MTRRALFALALVVVVTACSSGGASTTPTSLPPTTQAPTPIFPTGVADAMRHWVSYLDQGADDAAVALIAPRSQVAMGGRAGFAATKPTLDREWGAWAKTEGPIYDALPVAEGIAVVVLHTDPSDGKLQTGAMPMRAVGNDWFVEPLLSTGTFEAFPASGSKIADVAPKLSVQVEAGVRLFAFVDSLPAKVDASTGTATERVTYHAPRGLRPGWHLVTLVFQRGDDWTARVVRYRVADPAK